jgi:DEAD/DEAH box helicase domain-containing protein
VDGFRAFKECHPQAIYLHAGVTLEVTRLSEDTREVRVREVDVDYYTQPTTTEDTKVLRVRDRRSLGPGHVAWGDVRVTSRVVGYERKLVRGGVMLSQHPLTLPPQEFETQAVWLEAPYEVQRLVQVPGLHLMGALHALEHSMIALFPLFALCDRWDLGGISTPHHPDTGTASVFIYDGVPGGVGLARFAYGIYEDLLARTVGHVASCGCEEGCPSCIHSPKCGSRNSPLDKAGMLVLGRAFTRAMKMGLLPAGTKAAAAPLAVTTGVVPVARDRVGEPAVEPAVEPAEEPAEEPAAELPDGPKVGPAEARPEVARTPEEVRSSREIPPAGHTVVFDLETQKLAEEVGGWDNKRQMRMSVGVVYDITAGEFREYMEGEVRELVDDLARAALVVGFNIRNFDYEVLSAYVPRARLDAIPTLDILESVHRVLKRRVRLDDLTKATLGAGKIADGLDAVRWFRERNLVKLIEYCRHDVALTRDLYQYGLEHGHILYPSVQGTMKLPVGWS